MTGRTGGGGAACSSAPQADRVTIIEISNRALWIPFTVTFCHDDDDKARYLGHLSEEAVFIGTDEWERWPKHPDFVAYVESRFENGSGWTYRSVERTIRVSESADIAWFDEVLFSERNGRFRGTGVLTLQDDGWKIAHYAMSFLILNENWEEVIDLTKKTGDRKANN